MQQRGVHHIVVLDLVSEWLEASVCACGERLNDAFSHHLIVLRGSFDVASSGGQAESFALGLELGHCDLTIFGDDVDHCVQAIGKPGDLLSSSMPTHAIEFGLQLRDVNHGAIGLHFKGHGEGFTAIFIYHCCHIG